MDTRRIVLDLCTFNEEQEWFEFKENWFQPEALGEYVSVLCNVVVFGREYRKRLFDDIKMKIYPIMSL